MFRRVRSYAVLSGAFAVSSALLISCQGAPKRAPSSNGPELKTHASIPGEFLNYPSLLAEVADLDDRARTLGKKETLDDFREAGEEATDFKSLHQEKAGAFIAMRTNLRSWAERVQLSTPLYQTAEITKPLGETYEVLRISELKKTAQVFTFPNTGVAEREVVLRNEAFRGQPVAENPYPSGSEGASPPAEEVRYLQARLSCDGEFRLKRPWPMRDLKNVREAKFTLPDSLRVGGRFKLVPGPGVSRCELKLINPFADGEEGVVSIVREDLLFRSPRLASLTREGEVCVLPEARDPRGPIGTFLTDRFDQLTCPREVEELIPLDDPIDGVNAKVEMLLGQKLPRAAIEAQNPYVDLDFSKAPKLDGILVSYLVFRADFYGTLISRLLEWHARQGAIVRILVSDVISLKKDKRMYERLMAASPNIEVKLYKFRGKPFSKMGGWISALHRTDHVKIFLTYSESDPSRNEAIIGGRNIHDGFVFEQTYDRSKWPEVVNYAGGDESFVHWNDFEVRVKSRELIDAIAGQFFAVYSQDHDTFHVRPYSGQARSPAVVEDAWLDGKDLRIRHFVSIPYKDDRKLEDLFVTMIDSARRTLRISTPYLNLTPALADAFERAVDRGVGVQLITRIHLEGDTAGSVLGEVNKKAINKFYKHVKVFEYLVPKIILHSKFTLVDGEVAFVGSVNYNLRSFVHDMENGLLVHSPQFNAHMEKLFEKYKAQSRPIEEKQKLNYFRQILVLLGGKAF